MSHSFWRPSDEQRRTILLMEALGLIHDLGKLSDRFLESQEPEDPSKPKVEYKNVLLSDPRTIDTYTKHTNIPKDPSAKFVQKILTNDSAKPCAFSERADLNDLLKGVKFDWIGEQYTFAELMPLLTNAGLIKHPNWNGVVGKSMQPGLLIGYLHGIAHIEKEGDPKEHKQPYSHVFRVMSFGVEEQVDTSEEQPDKCSIHKLTNVLKALPLCDIQKMTADQRSDWLMQMKALMKRGLADNRRPHNEISLWDWGYTVATLTKAAAAYIFKNGWLPDIENLPFCTLRINLDILDRYTHSDKISDLLGIKQVLDDAFKNTQTLLEETYAFGNQFYRDETGAYYLLPAIFDCIEQKTLREEIQVLFPPDLRPQIYFSYPPITAGYLDNDKSRSRELVAEPRKQALNQEPINADNNLYLFETEWKEGRPRNAEICTVCGMRPVGYPRHGSQPDVEKTLSAWAKEDKGKQRQICRVCLDRRGRRSEQWINDGLQQTIWTDEVADDNGRLALFVGKLGLEGWLDGALLSTIQVTSNTAKNPSPARLYRIAETARAFWKKVTSEIMPNAVGLSPFRLELHPKTNNLDELGDYHAYDLDIDGVILSVVWDKPHQRFLTTDNLSYFAAQLPPTARDTWIRKLAGRRFQILEPSIFLQSSRKKAEVTIKEVKEIGGYQPAIPLLTEPSLCLMLIPANKALELAAQVKKEYEQQMGRVRDRLPLSVGLVFCNRRTPIRSVLEAGRALLNLSEQFDMNDGKGWEDWRLMRKDNSGSPCKLEFDNGITWEIPVVAGDGNTKDQWYPRLYQGDQWTQKQPCHVSELCELDACYLDQKVWIRPSRFDFEFLDSTARRFEIYYDKDGRRPRHKRPFYLEDLDRFDTLWKILQALEKSQRHQVIYSIEATREMWYGGNYDHSVGDLVFQQFVEDTLANAAWRKDKKWRDLPEEERQQLIDAGVRGELADLAELHMEILKERENDKEKKNGNL
ncbi:MAG: hypothetical protein IGS48_23865 [Oscillatoriales cyanobacterium C42_A2020_001]|nr:hypothetical protein [Leptolyngbyaceae cyanobacterium C42_A2020_001]